jgi:ribosomal protein S18 acetylase RimI-like enzyme
MQLVSLHDRAAIESLLRTDAPLHLYELGDLDDFFWPHTTWYGLEEAGVVRATALLYTWADLPVLIAHGRAPQGETVRDFVARLARVLPRRFHAHVAVGALRGLDRTWRVEPRGVHDRMVLADPSALEDVDTSRAVVLTADDAAELERVYASAYPGNWFSPRMLETGFYRGVREGDRLVSVAGVHVVSSKYRVAGIGNVATLPAFRGRGLGRTTVVALCRALAGTVDLIGLNVDQSNRPAIAMYEALGFSCVAQYEEALVEAVG